MLFTPKLMIFVEDRCIERDSSISLTKLRTSALASSTEETASDENRPLRIETKSESFKFWMQIELSGFLIS